MAGCWTGDHEFKSRPRLTAPGPPSQVSKIANVGVGGWGQAICGTKVDSPNNTTQTHVYASRETEKLTVLNHVLHSSFV